jgi:hypothetical protein
VKAELLLAVVGGVLHLFKLLKQIDAILSLMLTCEVSHKQTTSSHSARSNRLKLPSYCTSNGVAYEGCRGRKWLPWGSTAVLCHRTGPQSQRPSGRGRHGGTNEGTCGGIWSRISIHWR